MEIQFDTLYNQIIMRISTFKVGFILLLLITSTALSALGQIVVEDAVISDSRSNYLVVSFNQNITVSNADGFRLTGGTARIDKLIGGSGSNQLVFSLTDYALPDDDFKLLYWPELGDAFADGLPLQGFEDLDVHNQTSAYHGKGQIFYVSTSGNDSFNGTSPKAPLRSIDKALDKVGPGDFVLLKRGDQWNDNIIINKSGSPNNYITFGAYGNGKKPVIKSNGVSGSTSEFKYKGYILKGATLSVRGDYVLIDNINVIVDGPGRASDDGIQLLGCKYPVVSNCEVSATNQNGYFGIRTNTWVYNSSHKESALFNTTHPQVLNSEVYGHFRCLIGTQIWPFDGRHTIHEGGRIENCIARDIVKEGSSDPWENILTSRGDMNNFVIRKNKVFGFYSNGIETYGAKNIIIEHNTIHSPHKNTKSGRGIKAGGYNSAGQTASGVGELFSENVIVRYNTIYNIYHNLKGKQVGITTNNSKSGKVYGNLIYNIGEVGIEINGALNSKGFQVFNNTVINAGTDALKLYTQGSYAGNVEICNNILQGKDKDIRALVSSGKATGKNNILAGGKSTGAYNGQNDKSNALSLLFLNLSKLDFGLRENAPAVDQGVDMSAYKKDIKGNLITNKPDIGAFESIPKNN